MSPPWNVYPQMPEASLGWSLGPGAYYWIEFRNWFGKMGVAAREIFVAENAEPQGWTGFYARVQTSAAQRRFN